MVVVGINLLMSMVLPPRLDLSFLAEEKWGATSLSAVGGVWSVAVALTAAVATVVAVNRSRLPALRESMDAGANASVLPAFSVASLVGFGAVVAALPAFAVVRDWVLAIGGGPLASLAALQAAALRVTPFSSPLPSGSDASSAFLSQALGQILGCLPIVLDDKNLHQPSRDWASSIGCTPADPPHPFPSQASFSGTTAGHGSSPAAINFHAQAREGCEYIGKIP